MADEAISTPSHCLDEQGRVGGLAQGITESLDRSIETMIEIDERIGWPQLAA